MTDFVVPPRAPNTLPVVGSTALFPIGRVFCIGRNYRWTSDEAPPAEMPAWFMKPANTVLLAQGSLPYPPGTADFCHEIELVVALGRGGRDIDPAQVEPDHIWGYAAGLDLTRRDLQQQAKRAGGPWEPAKAFDHSAPCTPLVPARACGHPPRRRAVARGQWRRAAARRRGRSAVAGARAGGNAVAIGGARARRPDLHRHARWRGRAAAGRRRQRRRRGHRHVHDDRQRRSLTTSTQPKIALVTGAGSGIGRTRLSTRHAPAGALRRSINNQRRQR
ncbi:hypothetical protein M2282_005370 [Variovorax boronicumulans]|nr:hypothetical protein [Variovorax boronicumulans]